MLAGRGPGTWGGYTTSSCSSPGRRAATRSTPCLDVADLQTNTAWQAATDGTLGIAGGVDFNAEWVNGGLLAVHHGDSLGVYSYRPPVTMRKLADVRVPRPHFDIASSGPLLSIAWSGSGSHLIAAVDDGPAEFRVFEVLGCGRQVVPGAAYALCAAEPNMPNDVLTANGHLAPPPGFSTRCPTPDPSGTATHRPEPTSERTATAPPTPTPSETPSRMPTSTAPKWLPTSLACLPLVVRERCETQHRRADVALVIDTSSSMVGRKLADAKAAAAAFVAQMDLSPGRDQVAVVRYDTEAEVACRLTSARAMIDAAIRNLTSRSGTHIDVGLRTALAELQGPRHLERNLSVLILLTDGVQTGTPGEELRAAAEVRAAGARLYTIGLGADVDAATLREMAGDDSRYHFAPDSADLARIYAEITSDILCPAPAGGFWPGP